MVLGFQVEQVVDLIQKVENLVEPQVGQWVGLGGFSVETLIISMQIGLGWVAMGKIGLG